MAITNALVKAGTKAVSKATEKATTKAITKAAEKAATKAVSNALTKVGTKAGTSALSKLSGAGVSSLAKGAGSTLDGLLSKSSGLVLKNAPKATKGLASLADDYADTALAKTAKTELAERAARNNKLVSDLASDSDNMWFSASDLTDRRLGDVLPGNVSGIGTDPNTIIPAEKPAIVEMIKDGKLKVADDILNSDRIKRFELSGKPLSYNEKESLLEAIKEVLPEKDARGLALEAEDLINPNQMRLIDQEVAPSEMSIPVSGRRGRASEVPVEIKSPAKTTRATSGSGLADVPVESDNSALRSEINSLRERLAGATGGSGGGNVPPATPPASTPGSEGFNVKLKEGKNTTIQVGDSAVGSTRQQRAVRKLDDSTAKSMNANAKQYRDIVGKSGSIDGHYRSVAERMRAEKIDQANVADKAQAALSLREDIKQQALGYAEANGVTIDLSGIDNIVGLSPTQKRKLAELGLSLEDMVGGAKAVTPTQAEEIYKVLRDYAYNWEDSKDALTSMAGKSLKKEADAVRDLIDDTMDSLNVDYKTSLLEGASANGEDPAYLRKLAGKRDFKFSDLRKDQSDWLAMEKLAGNKIKEEPNLNVFGVDTGIPNPLRAGADRLKEGYYERVAGGAGASGGTVPPSGTGGYGAENTINFENVGGSGGRLGAMLGRARGAGLVGAGVLGGLLLGGGGGSGSSDMGEGLNSAVGMSPMGNTSSLSPAGEAQNTATELSNLTLGGYTYEQLENGYMAALMAGDEPAAKLIANMMGMLEDKMDRYYTNLKNQNTLSESSGGSGVAGKQKAAMNVLSNLMSNFDAKGVVSGNLGQFANWLTGGGFDPRQYAYDTGARGSLGTIIKALGDTGALSEGDQQRALNLLPATTDSPEAAKTKYQQLMAILQSAGTQ